MRTPRTVFLSGPAGSGKTTILRLSHEEKLALWGRTAAIDTDHLFLMVDPLWDLPYDDARTALVLRQCVSLVESFFGADYENVLIAGNSIHDAIDLNPVIPDLLRLGRVFHVSLDPSEAAVLRRTAGDLDRSPAHLINDLHLLRAKRPPWSAPVDNSTLNPLETLQEIARLVGSGEGELHGPMADV
ncbi:hypothetical protein E0H75_21890 [Kribbella capetownensis]|uniref:Uncharacterized protein n=1 Tax=Kribbella capetownensis TaxID=1572659 RepID=A0A4R0JM68_9ACTN|nr:hypothetical protein [Kribbella capetownensis]TCC47440.1 hypothetical protein E0H75_21890 [Kribbella capetownensis]